MNVEKFALAACSIVILGGSFSLAQGNPDKAVYGSVITSMQAKKICKTLDECTNTRLKGKASNSVPLRIEVPELGEIVRNADGSVRLMNHYEAEAYCQKQGSRLPTARELGLVSQSLGAKGFRETEYPNVPINNSREVMLEMSRMYSDGYGEVYTWNSAGEKVVDFYFGYSGYKRPAGDLGYYAFWSSSVVDPFAYDLDGYYGNGVVE